MLQVHASRASGHNQPIAGRCVMGCFGAPAWEAALRSARQAPHVARCFGFHPATVTAPPARRGDGDQSEFVAALSRQDSAARLARCIRKLRLAQASRVPCELRRIADAVSEGASSTLCGFSDGRFASAAIDDLHRDTAGVSPARLTMGARTEFVADLRHGIHSPIRRERPTRAARAAVIATSTRPGHERHRTGHPRWRGGPQRMVP
jgi:hypothetical protein